MKKTGMRLLAGAAGAGMVVTMVACSGGDGPAEVEADPNADVTIAVGALPPDTEPERRELFLSKVEAFEERYSNVTVKSEETIWAADTFQAKLAGGTLQNSLWVPFTEGQSLMTGKQVADLTDALEQTGLKDALNEELLALMTDDDGRIWGIPTNPYGIGLVYNRDVFVEAGLDPDAPPQTWDEVREAAKAISENTDAVGFAPLTTNNQGGWLATAAIYSFGGRVTSEDGLSSEVAGDDAKAYFELLHEMKWTDDSMGSKVLLDSDTMQTDFAAGKVGMTIGMTDVCRAVHISYDLPWSSCGMAGMPSGNGAEPATLAGGSFIVGTPKGDANQNFAAVNWADFYFLEKFRDEDAAVEEAEATANTDGGAVGLPRLPATTWEQYDEYMEWIEPYINVDVDVVQPYADWLREAEVVTEPVVNAQDVYALMDALVQKILGEESAVPSDLVDQTSEDIERAVQR